MMNNAGVGGIGRHVQILEESARSVMPIAAKLDSLRAGFLDILGRFNKAGTVLYSAILDAEGMYAAIAIKPVTEWFAR